MGARVVLLGRDRERIDISLNALPGDEVHFSYAVDLLDYERMQSLVEEIVDEVGPIDGVIHSAGISTTLPLKMVTPEKLDHFFRTNVHGAINLTRLVVRKSVMSDLGGSIVFISSVMGSLGEAGKLLYSLTKGALHAGSKSLALELAPRHIRVNCIAPGVVASPMSEKAVYSQDAASFERIKGRHPLGLGKPEDVAHAATFLLSDNARWITGTTLFVDGGYSAR
jgi:NAD(P)-dependent dehydrogenase (short-subunit alcohol dehydrogenase family)